MKLITENVNFKQSYIIAFILLGLFPIMPFVVKSFLLLPLFIVSLSRLIFFKKIEPQWNKIGIMTFIYFIFFVSVFYSQDLDRAIKLLIRLTPFLILPFSLGSVPQNIYYKCFNIFKKTFCLSCFVFCILVLLYSYSLNTSDFSLIYSYVSNEFWGYEDHPIYISLYFGIALIIISNKRRVNYMDIIMFVSILTTLIFLSRKGNIISLIVVLIFAAYYNRNQLFKKKVIIFFSLLLLVIICSSYFFNNFFILRFLEILNTNNIADSASSTGIRKILWKISVSVSSESPIYGFGLGDVQNNINYRLVEEGHKNLLITKNYNAHNQYLQILLSSGYLGLFSFITILIYLFRSFIKRTNKISLYIFLYIVLCFMFESILERQNGIIITALFFNIMLFSPNKSKMK